MSTKYETFEFQLIVLKILTAAMATHAVAICVHAVKIPIVQTHKPVKMENAKKYPATLWPVEQMLNAQWQTVQLAASVSLEHML